MANLLTPTLQRRLAPQLRALERTPLGHLRANPPNRASSQSRPSSVVHRRYAASSVLASSPVSASPPSPEETPLPLQGITIISLEQAIAAPFCTRQLADQGARVIKVERPGTGDFARQYDTRIANQASHFIWTNRSKESLALDLKLPKDLSVLKKLLGKADVLVQNLAPGAAARMGLSFEALQQDHPGLIVCDISGYGSNGPYRDKKAYDLLIQAEAGLLSTTGFPNQPAKVGISIADIAAGMYAYTNILTALSSRARTGKGKAIDISMLESMAEWMTFPLYYTHNNAPPPTPAGASHAAIYPYGPFGCGDGSTVMLGIQNEREWVNFCDRVLDNASLAQDSRFKTNALRSQNRKALDDVILTAFAKSSGEQVLQKLDAASIANAAVNDMQGVWKHAQLEARRRWTEVDTPGGRVPALLPPGANVGEVRMDAVPAVGEHNERILRELGIERE